MDKFLCRRRPAETDASSSRAAPRRPAETDASSSRAAPRLLASGPKTAACPICGVAVDVKLMGHHVDSSCRDFCGPPRKRARTSPAAGRAGVVYTIGHGTLDEARVLRSLEARGVTALVDVRSFPDAVTVTAGVDNAHWRRRALETSAARAKVCGYEWRGDALGGRGGDERGGDASRDAALDAVAARCLGPSREALCLMCCELRHTSCHRERLATALVARGCKVVHVRADASTNGMCGDAEEAHPSPLATLKASEHGALKGQYTVPDFLSEAEEARLLDWLDDVDERDHPWVVRDFNGRARGKAWGVRTDLKRRAFADPLHAMPPIFTPLIRRARQLLPDHLKGAFFPNEANALDYRKAEGHALLPHCDDRQLSGPVLLTVCLAGAATMTYVADKQRNGEERDAHKVRLPRRALQVQSGSVRFDYQHAIQNADFHDDRRVSITFRMNKREDHRVY